MFLKNDAHCAHYAHEPNLSTNYVRPQLKIMDRPLNTSMLLGEAIQIPMKT